MIRIATMESVNPVVILAAMLWNAVYVLVAFALVIPSALLGLTRTAVVRLAVGNFRMLAMIAGLVSGVILAAIFWQIVLCTLAAAGIIYSGLMIIKER